MSERILRPADLAALGQELPQRRELADASPKIAPGFAEAYDRMPAAEAKERYLNDPEFAKLVDEIDRKRAQ